MNSWRQPICLSCYAAYLLGRGESPTTANPVSVSLIDPDPCLICGMETRIFVRVDPKLTQGLIHARKEES
jgi:hypothetical protein